MKPTTIVFVHGMYATPLCWEGWVAYCQAKGYTCLAPAWPGRDQPIETLRKHPLDPQVGRLTLSDVLDYLTETITALDEKPALVGHSMGGLLPLGGKHTPWRCRIDRNACGGDISL